MEARALKKYSKLLVMGIVIILAMSVHYFQTATALQLNKEKFQIETVAGNESELEDIMLQATYYDSYLSHWIYISKDGVQDVRERGYSSLFTAYQPFQLDRYLQDYRSFMRGKNFDLSQYNEQDERVIYVNSPYLSREVYKGEQITFEVDVLEKDSQQHTTFTVTALATSNYDWLQILDVYAGKDEIQLLVSSSLNGRESSVQLYTISEQAQQIIEQETLLEAKNEKANSSNIMYYGNAFALENAAYYVLQSTMWHFSHETGVENKERGDYHIYSLETKEMTTLPVPDSKNIQTAFQQGEYFYAVATTLDELTLHRYHLRTKQWEEPLTIKQSFTSDYTPYVQIKDGRLYVATPVKNTSELAVYDASTAELLYKGIIKGELSPQAEILVEQIF